MAIREERTLDINIICANDLEKVMTFGKQKCFVSAYVSSLQKKATPLDQAGGRNPAWNCKLALNCDESIIRKPASHLTLDIYTQCPIINKLVGSVTIPLHGGSWSTRSGTVGKPQVMACQVYRRSGRVQGTLHIAVKLGEKKVISTWPPRRSYGPKQIGIDSSYEGSQFNLAYESTIRSNAFGRSQLFVGKEASPKHSQPIEGGGSQRFFWYEAKQTYPKPFQGHGQRGPSGLARSYSTTSKRACPQPCCFPVKTSPEERA